MKVYYATQQFKTTDYLEGLSLPCASLTPAH